MAHSALPPALRLALAHPPWSAQAWRNTLFVATGAAMLFPAAGTPVALAAFLFGGVKSGIFLAAVTLAIMPFVVSALTVVQRSRFRVLLGVDIPRAPAPRGRRWRRAAVSPRPFARWRQAAYHFLVTPLMGVTGSVPRRTPAP